MSSLDSRADPAAHGNCCGYGQYVVVAALGQSWRIPPYCHVVGATTAIATAGVSFAALFAWGRHPDGI